MVVRGEFVGQKHEHRESVERRRGVIEVGHEGLTKNLLPDPVDQVTGEERVLAGDDPAGQGGATVPPQDRLAIEESRPECDFLRAGLKPAPLLVPIMFCLIGGTRRVTRDITSALNTPLPVRMGDK